PINIKYGNLLTSKEFAHNPLIGRKKEMRKMCALLMDEEKSLIIHGKPGVGKTALINGLAYNIIEGTAPTPLKDAKIIEITGTEIVSGCKLVGMIEERMQEILDEVMRIDNAILFIDEIHTLIGLGAGSNDNNDVSNILKPYLGNGGIKIIGATTTEEYKKIIESGAFARRFNGEEIPIPTEREVLEILQALITRYKETKNIGFFKSHEEEQAILNLIIEFSNRKNPNVVLNKELYNPDLALTILRNGYNFAMLDNLGALDVHHLIEGVESMDYYRERAKQEFKEKALALTRTNSNIHLV
ncbi:MAG: AAA family ATPase, partial [Bacilli bacterium]|nr:AAA family ATPase [Bacilli bacterium]